MHRLGLRIHRLSNRCYFAHTSFR